MPLFILLPLPEYKDNVRLATHFHLIRDFNGEIVITNNGFMGYQQEETCTCVRYWMIYLIRQTHDKVFRFPPEFFHFPMAEGGNACGTHIS